MEVVLSAVGLKWEVKKNDIHREDYSYSVNINVDLTLQLTVKLLH